jgi:hypothetical protein
MAVFGFFGHSAREGNASSTSAAVDESNLPNARRRRFGAVTAVL